MGKRNATRKTTLLGFSLARVAFAQYSPDTEGVNVDSPTVEPMTWWNYVCKVAKGEPQAEIARRVGITPSSVGRWGKGSNPDPAQAAELARAYGRPVLEAFVAAGFLTSDEAGERPSAPPSLASLNDDELLDEVRRRMQGGQSWDAGNTSGPEDEPQAGDVAYLPIAARSVKRGTASKDQPDQEQS